MTTLEAIEEEPVPETEETLFWALAEEAELAEPLLDEAEFPEDVPGPARVQEAKAKSDKKAPIITMFFRIFIFLLGLKNKKGGSQAEPLSFQSP